MCLFFVFSLPLLLGIALVLLFFHVTKKEFGRTLALSVPRRNAGSSTVPLRTVKFQGEGAFQMLDGGRNLGGAIKPSQKEDERIGSFMQDFTHEV